MGARRVFTIAFVVLLAACGSSDKTGEACSTDGDCGHGYLCVFKIADGCGAKASCQPLPTGVMCNSGMLVCSCAGTSIGVGCGTPSGYASEPVLGPRLGSTCAAPEAGAD